MEELTENAEDIAEEGDSKQSEVKLGKLQYKVKMDDASELLSLPLEVLTYIGHFLSPELLCHLSVTCKRLRTAINSNSVWRRHLRGQLSLLETSASIVEPRFTVPAHSLDPLCDNWLHYIKHNRLLHNLKQGQFVHHSVDSTVEACMFTFDSDFPSCQGKVIYNNDYLFMAGRMFFPEKSRYHFVIEVYNIREDPQLVTTFVVENVELQIPAETISSIYMRLNVVGEKLVVLHDKGFNVHEINLPSATFPPLHSVNWYEPGQIHDMQGMFFGNFVVKLRSMEFIVWNIHTAEKVVITRPFCCENVRGVELLNLKSDEGLMLICFIVEEYCYDVYVYDANRQRYTIQLNYHNSYEICGGVVGNNRLVLHFWKNSVNHFFVYDYKKKNLVIHNTNQYRLQTNGKDIIDQYLIIPGHGDVKVFNVDSLELLYELPAPQHYNGMINIWRGLCNLVVMENVWDLVNGRKMFSLENGSQCASVNDAFSKIVSMDWDRNVHIYSFW